MLRTHGPEREWTTEERDFVASVADLIAIKYRASQIKKLKKSIENRDTRLVALEKSDALAKMALGVAHDFRNILVGITNSLFVVRSSQPSPKPWKQSPLSIALANRVAS